jgi:hypothetical protein
VVCKYIKPPDHPAILSIIKGLSLHVGLPAALTIYKLLTDWGSFIGGGIALIAGVLAYIGARQAAAKQIAAMARKDRLQARGIVVGVYPELLQLQVSHDRASAVMAGWSDIDRRTMNVMHVVPGILNAKIPLTPVLFRNVDNLFLVQPRGESLQRVISCTLQYNTLIDTLAQQVTENIRGFDPPAHQGALAGNLRAIRIALDDAMREIGSLHDEATAPTAS